MKNSFSTFSKLVITLVLIGICYLNFVTSLDLKDTFQKLILSGQNYSSYDYTMIILIFLLYLLVTSNWLYLYLESDLGNISVKYGTRELWIISIVKYLKKKCLLLYSIYLLIIFSFAIFLSKEVLLFLNYHNFYACLSLYLLIIVISRAQLFLAIRYTTLLSTVIVVITFVIGMILSGTVSALSILSFGMVANYKTETSILLGCLILLGANICLYKLILNQGSNKEFI